MWQSAIKGSITCRKMTRRGFFAVRPSGCNSYPSHTISGRISVPILALPPFLLTHLPPPRSQFALRQLLQDPPAMFKDCVKPLTVVVSKASLLEQKFYVIPCQILVSPMAANNELIKVPPTLLAQKRFVCVVYKMMKKLCWIV